MPKAPHTHLCFLMLSIWRKFNLEWKWFCVSTLKILLFFFSSLKKYIFIALSWNNCWRNKGITKTGCLITRKATKMITKCFMLVMQFLQSERILFYLLWFFKCWQKMIFRTCGDDLPSTSTSYCVQLVSVTTGLQ